jgi:hypothetical protein
MKILKRLGTAIILIALLAVCLPAASITAQGLTVFRELPAENLSPGEAFEVTVSFTAQADDFNAIGFTGTAPDGWEVAVNTAWCTPAATYSNINSSGKAEYVWLAAYDAGTEFTVGYRVTVPEDATDGTYSFPDSYPDSYVEYYLAGEGPFISNLMGNPSVTVAEDTNDFFTLTVNTTGNGTVNKNPDQGTYAQDALVELTAAADPGWSFSNWSGDLSSNNPSEFIIMTGNKSVTATFTINTYTLTYTAGDNGSISGEISQTVEHGASGTAVTAVPDSGYHFAGWSDGVTTATRTDTNVTDSITVTANFAADSVQTYTITAIAGDNGSISPSGNVEVEEGQSLSFTITPDPGCQVDNVEVDGLSAGPVTIYTFTNVTENHTIEAAFRAITTDAVVTINAPADASFGSDFTASIDIDDVTDLTAANYTVTFDPGVLRLDNVTEGYINSTAIPVGAYNENPTGTLNIVQSLPMSGGISSVSGNGTLAVLHFHVSGDTGMSSQIQLSEGCLADKDASEIPATWLGDTVEISKASQTIIFEPLSDKGLGDAPFTINATVTSGLPVTFTVVSGPATIDGNTVTLTGIGTVVIRASQAGNDYYDAAEDVERSFRVVDRTGDINGDGEINAQDITYLELVIVGLENPTPRTDVNGDGKVNALDIVTLMMIILDQDQI